MSSVCCGGGSAPGNYAGKQGGPVVESCRMGHFLMCGIKYFNDNSLLEILRRAFHILKDPQNMKRVHEKELFFVPSPL